MCKFKKEVYVMSCNDWIGSWKAKNHTWDINQKDVEKIKSDVH